LLGDGEMLDAAWDGDEVASLQVDVLVAEADEQFALEDEEELVLVWVGVPDELAVEPGESHVGVVDAGEEAWSPGLGERGEFGGEGGWRGGGCHADAPGGWGGAGAYWSREMERGRRQ